MTAGEQELQPWRRLRGLRLDDAHRKKHRLIMVCRATPSSQFAAAPRDRVVELPSRDSPRARERCHALAAGVELGEEGLDVRRGRDRGSGCAHARERAQPGQRRLDGLAGLVRCITSFFGRSSRYFDTNSPLNHFPMTHSQMLRFEVRPEFVLQRIGDAVPVTLLGQVLKASQRHPCAVSNPVTNGAE